MLGINFLVISVFSGLSVQVTEDVTDSDDMMLTSSMGGAAALGLDP
ncbi:hypothetical protein [Streptomyces sp. NBC_01207]|nr:hypothetical protein OG457_49330 [Streptomyces sp. NBC_01207]